MQPRSARGGRSFSKILGKGQPPALLAPVLSPSLCRLSTLHRRALRSSCFGSIHNVTAHTLPVTASSGFGLTRRCSGLASLAAELHNVRQHNTRRGAL